MTRNAYEPSTIKYNAKRLKQLLRYTKYDDPEQVKEYIAKKEVSNAYKESLIETYAIYMRMLGRQWEQPFYDRYDKPPTIPKEQKINLLIAHAQTRMSLFLSMMKDMGTRPVELTWLKLGDIDLQRGNVNITGAKHTVGRIGKLKPKTLAMLKAYVIKKNMTLNSRLFPTTSDNICRFYNHMRNALADKLKDPEIRTIKLYDFRRWKATNEFRLTNNIIHVQELLGHKDIRTTRLYAKLSQALDDDPDWIVESTTDQKRVDELIEKGFEYVLTTPDGYMKFRKRK